MSNESTIYKNVSLEKVYVSLEIAKKIICDVDVDLKYVNTHTRHNDYEMGM